jgi:hypothetical protein
VVRWHDEPIAVEDAFVAHAEAAHLQQVIGAWIEERRIDGVVAQLVFDGEHRAAGGDQADQRQAARLLDADAARQAGRELDGALAFERSEVLEDTVGGRDSERTRELRARRGDGDARRYGFGSLRGSRAAAPVSSFSIGDNPITMRDFLSIPAACRSPPT